MKVILYFIVLNLLAIKHHFEKNTPRASRFSVPGFQVHLFIQLVSQIKYTHILLLLLLCVRIKFKLNDTWMTGRTEGT